jgi:transcriptional antiterminator NusG
MKKKENELKDINNKDNIVEDTNTSVDQQDIEQKVETDAKKNKIKVVLDEDEINLYRNSPEAKWYVLHTFSGYEQVAKDNLETVIEKFNLQKRIFDIVIPMEDVIEEKNGKKKLVSRKIMPCYLLVKMIYGDDLWHNVIRTRGITGFVGPKGRPLALTEDEIRKMRLEKLNINITLDIGDRVEVIDGPLMNTVGTVMKVDAANNRARVNVEMFGRETPIDLDFSQVRKIK